MDRIRAFDGHCDAIALSYVTGEPLRGSRGHISLDKLEAYDRYAQFFACFITKDRTGGRPMWEVFQEEARLFHRQVADNAGRIALCTCGDDLDRAWETGKVGAFLSVEGADLLGCDPDNLDYAREQGVRAVNLTWNYANALSGSNVEEPERGLSARGKEFVRRMNDLGMLVDVSHLSDPGFWDVAEVTSSPIFASHSNSRSKYFHPRNLTDAQFTAIIKLQGVVGLNLCPKFLGNDPDVDTVVAHLEHFLDLGGGDCVALGGDWDGIERLPRGMKDVTGWIVLYDRLKALGYDQELLDKLFYKNLMRVVRKVCTM